MPRRVDYAARFEFVRHAAFVIVRDQSVDALTRRRVAAELGCGLNTVRRLIDSRVDLVRMAADEVVTRRRQGRLNRRTADPVERVGYLVRAFMPEDSSHLDEEVVWLKLVAASSLRPSGLEPPGEARRAFQIAQHGYDDGPMGEPEPEGPEPEREDHRAALQPYVDRHQAALADAVHQMLELMDAPGPRAEVAVTVTAVIEGLTLAACLGRIEPEQATRTAIAHVVGLRPPMLAEAPGPEPERDPLARVDE